MRPAPAPALLLALAAHLGAPADDPRLRRLLGDLAVVWPDWAEVLALGWGHLKLDYRDGGLVSVEKNQTRKVQRGT